MLIPLRTDVPQRATPWMNWLIILANMLVYFIQVKSESITDRYHLSPSDPHLLNYFTYAFLHANFAHLLSNLLFLYIFGNNVNGRLGHAGYLAFYLAGGVIAGAAHVWAERAPVIGASGAVFAVTGAFLILFPRSHVTILYFFIVPGTLEIPSLWFVGAFFAINIFNQFSEMMGAQSQVAHLAHLGGGFFGAGVCILLLAVGLLPRDPFDVIAMISRWNRRRQYRDMVSKGYDPFAYTGGGDPRGRSGSGRGGFFGGAGTHDPAPAAGDRSPGGLGPHFDRVQDLRGAIGDSVTAGRLDDAARLYGELRTIDPAQVLARQTQLDLANHLYATDQHAPAVDAYEGFLRFYSKSEEAGRVRLMLGLLYARYLNRPDLAEPHLRSAMEKVRSPREVELAQRELNELRARHSGPPPLPGAQPG